MLWVRLLLKYCETHWFYAESSATCVEKIFYVLCHPITLKLVFVICLYGFSHSSTNHAWSKVCINWLDKMLERSWMNLTSSCSMMKRIQRKSESLNQAVYIYLSLLTKQKLFFIFIYIKTNGEDGCAGCHISTHNFSF